MKITAGAGDSSNTGISSNKYEDPWMIALTLPLWSTIYRVAKYVGAYPIRSTFCRSRQLRSFISHTANRGGGQRTANAQRKPTRAAYMDGRGSGTNGTDYVLHAMGGFALRQEWKLKKVRPSMFDFLGGLHRFRGRLLVGTVFI